MRLIFVQYLYTRDVGNGSLVAKIVSLEAPQYDETLFKQSACRFEWFRDTLVGYEQFITKVGQ